MSSILLLAMACAANAGGLDAARLGVVFNSDDPNSRAIAQEYAALHAVPAANVIGARLPRANTIERQAFDPIRTEVLNRMPSSVQSLLLVWSRPFAVGCMSVTTAFAAGYGPEFCEPGCGMTAKSALFDSDGWLPADSVGWWPAMLFPTDDAGLARALMRRGAIAQSKDSRGTLYLIRSGDPNRNVRAATYAGVEAQLANRIRVVELATPIKTEVPDVIGYFTGVSQVAELARLHFLPGAVADHLTSTGGLLAGGSQMSATAWLAQGATGSFGTVSEPCNHLEKFPNIAVLMKHYERGETLLESYWKSVAMPGQGLFVGDPLARPFGARRR